MRVVTVLGVAAATALAGSLAVAAPAQAVTGPTVDHVTLSKTSLAMSGIHMAAQTLTAHIVDPTAAPVVPTPPPGARPSPVWMFELTATGGTGTLRAMHVLPVLTAGTLADGTWYATVNMPSTADGIWALSRVSRCDSSDCGGSSFAVTGAPTFPVTGVHQPRLSLRVIPSPLPYPRTGGVVKGRVVDADTGLGMPGIPVGFGADTNCVQFPPDGPIAFPVVKVTNAGGNVAFAPSNLRQLSCVGILGPLRSNSDGYSVFPVFRTFSVPVRPIVTAKPMATSAQVGTPVRVRGAVYGHTRTGTIVVIQQLHGRTAWRTVVYAAVGTTGYYSAWPAPTVRGTNVYRAVSPVQDLMAYAVSKTFTVRGT